MSPHSSQPGPAAASDRRSLARYAIAVLACAATTFVALPLREHVDVANIVMLFLLTVLLVALRAGRGPAVLSAVLCVLLFDFLFVQPRFSFAVAEVQYVITLGVMLAVALITAQLATRLHREAELAALRERRTSLPATSPVRRPSSRSPPSSLGSSSRQEGAPGYCCCPTPTMGWSP
jgi:two-component system sensor histidine kinase KdpD